MVKLASIFCLCLLLSPPAYACGMLEKAEPAVGSTLAASPGRVTLHFTQGVIVPKSTLEVADAADHKVNTGKAYGTEDANSSELSTKVNALPPGKYKVTWNVTWHDCGVATQGHYKFTVQ